jgi:glycosyltransferase involved in cell wall biosynthesis
MGFQSGCNSLCVTVLNFFHLVNVRWFNATAWYAINLGESQNNAGHNVLIGAINNTSLVKISKAKGLRTFEAPFNTANPLGLINVILKAEKVLRNFSPQVINCHRGELFWYFAIRKLFNKKHILIRFRGDIRKPNGNLLNRLIHRHCADLIIVSANFIKDYFVRDLGINKNKVIVLYGGVDTDFFKPDEQERRKTREELGLIDSNFLVGIVGRFDPVKGHKTLIEAISYLYYEKRIENIRLVIAGYDSVIRKDDIKRYVEINKISTITHFFDFREDINNIYRACDLIAVPSISSEAICRVAMEAMATGVPVIGADTGVLPEILPDENIFCKNNVKDLSNKIINHSKNLTLFPMDIFFKKYMEYVEKLLNL